jgi:hypothetical protein
MRLVDGRHPLRRHPMEKLRAVGLAAVMAAGNQVGKHQDGKK